MNIKIYIFLIVILCLFYIYNLLEFHASCRQLSDWTLYLNANNCGFCLRQIEFLGSNAKNINIVHCDDKKNIRECSNINELPLWRRGGTSLPGARLSSASLRELSKL